MAEAFSVVSVLSEAVLLPGWQASGKQEEKNQSLKAQPIVFYLRVQEPVRCLRHEFPLCRKGNNALVLNK